MLAMLATREWVLHNLKPSTSSPLRLYFIVDPSFVTFAESLHRSMVDQRKDQCFAEWHFITLKKKPWYRFFKEVKSCAAEHRDVDIILDWHQDWRSWLLTLFHPQALVIAPARRTLERWWLRHLHQNIYDWDGPTQISRSLLQRWLRDTSNSTEPALLHHSSVPITSNPVTSTILLFPGAAHGLKQWPMKYWLALAEMIDQSLPLNFSLRWIWGPHDAGVGELSAFRSSRGRSVFFNPGDLSLNQLPAMIEQASLVICNDSFPAHVAKALGRPSAVFFGPTHEAFGFAYVEDPQYLLLSVSDLPCRPCSSTGAGECRFEVQHCLVDLNPSLVWGKIKEKYFHERV